jgi:hypothetical protein
MFAAIISMRCVTFANAQDTDPSVSSLIPVDARYEIVQSPLNIRDTFRLDRWSGATGVLLESPDDKTLVWRFIPMDDPPQVTPTKPRFQLTVSGVAAKGAYLIDTVTGDSWAPLGKNLRGDGSLSARIRSIVRV